MCMAPNSISSSNFSQKFSYLFSKYFLGYHVNTSNSKMHNTIEHFQDLLPVFIIMPPQSQLRRFKTLESSFIPTSLPSLTFKELWNPYQFQLPLYFYFYWVGQTFEWENTHKHSSQPDMSPFHLPLPQSRRFSPITRNLFLPAPSIFFDLTAWERF